MTTSLNKKVDKAIANYLNKADYHVKNRNLAWISLAWSIFNDVGGERSSSYNAIRDNIPEATTDPILSIRSVLSEEEYKQLIANSREVIGAVCRNYSSSPFSSGDIHADDELVAHMMVKIADPKADDRIYLPFAGMGTVMDYLPDNLHLVGGEEIDPTIWALSRIRNFVFGTKIHVNRIRIGDSFETLESTKKDFEEYGMFNTETSLFEKDFFVPKHDPRYDLIIMSPPYAPEKGETKKLTETWHKPVSMALDLLKPDGRMIVAIPLLFIGRMIDKQFIAKLLGRQLLKRVVEIKSPVDSSSKRYLNDSIAILELSKAPVSEVEFIDVNEVVPNLFELTEEYIGSALDRCLNSDSDPLPGVNHKQISEIKNNNIFPSYYTAYESIALNPHISVGECMSVIRTPYYPTIAELPVAELNDLSENYLDCEIEISKLHKLSAGKRHKYKTLTQSALLVGFPMTKNFSIGKITLSEGEKVLLGNNIIPFSINTETVDPDYLMKELTSPRFLEFYFHVTPSIFHTHVPDGFFDLIIPLPDRETQTKIVLDDARNSLSRKQAELIGFNQKQLTEIRLRKHTLISKFATFENNWRSLMDFLRENGGKIDLEQDGGWLARMGESLKMIGTQLNNLTQTEEDFGDNLPVNPDILIDSYCENNMNRSSNFRFLRADPTDASVKISIPKRAFDRIMENIVNNAVSHGFCNSERKDYTISIEALVEGNYVYINISNNGLPLCDKISPEEIFELGRSASMYSNSHEGQGGYDIRKIMEMFGGKVSVISTPGSEYTITYKLKFKKHETK